MNVAIASVGGCSVHFAARLIAEGHVVRMWPTDPDAGNEPLRVAKCGLGIVPLARSWADLFAWAKDAARTAPTIVLFDESRLGKHADEARKAGLYVVGGSSFCDRAEKDRAFGFALAEEMGAQLPPFVEFAKISDAIAYAEEMGDVASFWKSDKYLGGDATQGTKDGAQLADYLRRVQREHGDAIKSIIQQKIEGVAISTERWFNGREFVGPWLGDIEHKKFMNDEIGPATGCAFNSVWAYGEEATLAERMGFDNLAAILRANEAPPGIYDANVIVDDEGEPWFLEWCARFGWDSEPATTQLVADFGRWLWYVATGQGDGGGWSDPGTIAHAIRLSVPPYPTESVRSDDEASPIGVPIRGEDGLWSGHFIPYQVMREDDGGLAVAGPEGLVGLSLAVGRNVRALNDACVSYARDGLRVPGLQFRTDAAKCVARDAADLAEAGIDDLPGGLTR